MDLVDLLDPIRCEIDVTLFNVHRMSRSRDMYHFLK